MFPGLKRQLHVFAPLGAGLLIITMVTALGGLWNYQNELNDQLSAKPQAVITGLSLANQTQHKPDSGTAAGSASGGAAGPGQATGNDSSLMSGSVAVPVGTSAPAQKSSNDGPAAISPSSVISVSLSVDGRAQGSVKMPSGSNQCDVLSQALAEGVISSLDMRYISQYGTEGVYVINGLGDPDTVWWTYTVNGTPPPYGCGYMPARNGDSVNWQYIKS